MPCRRRPVWDGLGACLALVACAAPAGAGVVLVPGDQPTIQQAIAVAQDGDTILVAPGTYLEAIDYLGKGLRIQSQAGSHDTVIDAQGVTSVVTCRNGEPAGTALIGFTLTGGTGQPVIPTAAARGGGAVFVGSLAHLLVEDCNLTGNHVTGPGNAFGGGIFIQAGVVDVSGCSLASNSAKTDGSALYADTSGDTAVTLASCNVVSNVLSGPSVGAAVTGGLVSVQNCLFQGNEGDGLQHATGLGILDCTFVGNEDTGLLVKGAASVQRRVERCKFIDNGLHGLILDSTQADSAVDHVVRKCLFAGGDGLQSFGLILGPLPQTVVVENCSLDGGLLTVVGNSAQTTITVTNTILRGTLLGFPAALATVSYCDVTGGWPGSGNIDADPLWVDPPNLDYHLQAGSPCINAGSPASPPDADGSPADMGALTYHPWTVLGGAVAGSAGLPSLVGTGPLIGGEDLTLTLTGALVGQDTTLLLGLSSLGVPLKGGTLWPTPDVALSGFTADLLGTWSVTTVWPGAVPSAFSFWLQVWFPDAGAVKGFAASNGLRATTP